MQMDIYEILDNNPQIEKMLREAAWRKYALQDVLNLSRGEVDLLLSLLMKEGLVESTSLGWRWRRD